MIKLKLESCQVPQHSYKRGGNNHLEIPNLLDRQFDVVERQIPCGAVMLCIVYSEFSISMECLNEPRVYLKFINEWQELACLWRCLVVQVAESERQ